MEKRKANQIAKLWNELHCGSTAPAKTLAIVVASSAEKGYYAVEIHPTGDNVGWCFYANEELVDVTRAFKVSSYVTIDDGKLIGRLF